MKTCKALKCICYGCLKKRECKLGKCMGKMFFPDCEGYQNCENRK